ncbi:hypothetical protein CBL_20755 [Carabus blaptoides fortunei]
MYQDFLVEEESFETTPDRTVLGITVEVVETTVVALIDTDSKVTCVAEDLWLTLRLKGIMYQHCPSTVFDRQTFNQTYYHRVDWMHENFQNTTVSYYVDGIEVTEPFKPRIKKIQTALNHVESQACRSRTIWDLAPEVKLWNKVNATGLSQTKPNRPFDILIQHHKIFPMRPGLTLSYEHKITLKDNAPFTKRSYRVPYALRDAVEKQLKTMVDLGNKDGTVHICRDARALNDKMIADCEASPCVEELIQQFHHARFLTSIDLRSSYWQTPLHRDSRRCTAFLYNQYEIMK